MLRIIIKIGTASALLLAVMVLMQVPGAQAYTQVFATNYDMYNGNSGYLDDTYSPDPSNNHLTAGAYLSGGKGDLTDGVYALAPSGTTPGPFVGWQNYDPTITFHFAEGVNIDTMVLWMDGSPTGGAVQIPEQVAVTMGSTTIISNLNEAPDLAGFQFNIFYPLSNNELEITLYQRGEWIMLYEVQFYRGVNSPDVPLPPPSSYSVPASWGW
jgi:hypothetical protein